MLNEVESYNEMFKLKNMVAHNLRVDCDYALDVIHDKWLELYDKPVSSDYARHCVFQLHKQRLPYKYRSRSKAASILQTEDLLNVGRDFDFTESLNVNRYLNILPPKYRELLERIYLREEDRETIMRDMKLSKKSFDLTKNRALTKIRKQFHINPKGCVHAY